MAHRGFRLAAGVVVLVHLLALAPGGAAPRRSKLLPVDQAFLRLEEERQRADEFPWARKRPLDFLAMLAAHPPYAHLSEDAPPGWIGEADLPGLVEQLANPDPCALVVRWGTAGVPSAGSTVDREAARLLEGFRTGRYPLPAAPSARHLRSWWKEWQQSQPVRDARADGGELTPGATYRLPFHFTASAMAWAPMPAVAGVVTWANAEELYPLQPPATYSEGLDWEKWAPVTVTFRVESAKPARHGQAGSSYRCRALRIEGVR